LASGVLSATALGVLAWLLTSPVLTSIDFNRITGTLTTLVAILIFVRLYRRVPDVAVGARRSLSWPALGLRSGLAAGIIFAITGFAHVLSPAWAGVMAAFPVTMYPFLVILHLTHGRATVAAVIKHYPAGLGSLLRYALCISLTYDSLGLNAGTLIGFGVATSSSFLISNRDLQFKRLQILLELGCHNHQAQSEQDGERRNDVIRMH